MSIELHIDSKIEEVKRSINAVVYGVLAEVIQRVDERSPVGDIAYWKYPKKAPKGYVGGQFRGNWQLGVNEQLTEFLEGKIDPSGTNTVAENIAKIPERPAYGKQYYLVNNCPYALRIEEGWSRQAPRGVVGLTLLELNSIVRDVCADIKVGGGRTK